MSGPLHPRGVLIDLAAAAVGATDAAYRRLLDRADDAPLAVTNGCLSLHPDGHPHRVEFGVDDMETAGRLLARRGLSPDEPFGVTDAVTRRASAHYSGAHDIDALDIDALDHLVVSAPSRDHALALFGATLDLDFRLEQEFGGVRQLFFRSADVVVEVVTGADPAVADATTCSLWGLAWRSVDLDATHRRLAGEGVDVSEIRTGRKPGTRIFTVRDPALATRTVVLSGEPQNLSDPPRDGRLQK